MLSAFSRQRAIGGVLMFALAACSDSPTGSGVQIDEMATADVAAVAGDQTFEDVSAMRHHQGAFGAPLATLPRFGAWSDDCTFDPVSARFTCPEITHGGFAHSRSYQLLDEHGAPQSEYDAIATASASIMATTSGSAARGAFSATFTRQRTFTVSGLLGAETTHSWSGTGSATHSRTRHTDGGLTRSYAMTGSSTVTDVVLPFPPSVDGWPLSGSIVRQVSFSRDVGPGSGNSGSRTVTVTFNGTQLVPMTVNGREFTLDLATGRPVRE